MVEVEHATEPLPTYNMAAGGGVVVHGLDELVAQRLMISFRVIVGDIFTQEPREFERAAQSGKTASLLEQDRPNVFSMAVANVLPGDQVTVELHYSELLLAQDGQYEFVYPSVVGPRYASARPETELLTVREGPYLAQGDSPDSRFEVEVELAGATEACSDRVARRSDSMRDDEALSSQLAACMPTCCASWCSGTARCPTARSRTPTPGSASTR